MNKLGLVLGVAAVAAIAGCKDPNHIKHRRSVQNETQPVATQPVDEPAPAVTPVEAPEKGIEVVDEGCKCPAGTVHKEPCACGAVDCKCIVAAPAVDAKPVVTPAAEETTPYIVQRGDYLAKISKKYNITIAAIKRVNPNLKGDVVRVGQTIQLPGKVNVGEQTKPVVAPAAPKVVKEYKPYTGATKDYKIQNGDSLGLIAKKNGISVRQLKELNGLQSDVIRVGKTLKVPAEKVAAGAAVAAAPVVAKAEKPVEAKVEKKVESEAPVAVPEAKKCTCAPGTVHTEPCACGADDCQCTVKEPEAPAAAPTTEEGPTHVVREGEDLTSLSILYSLSPAEIRSFNNLGENDELKVGQVIKLPADSQL